MKGKNRKARKPQSNVVRKAKAQRQQKENYLASILTDIEKMQEVLRDEYNENLLHMESSNRELKTKCLSFAVMLAKDSPDDFTETAIKNTAQNFVDWVTGGNGDYNISEPEFITREEVEKGVENAPIAAKLKDLKNGKT